MQIQLHRADRRALCCYHSRSTVQHHFFTGTETQQLIRQYLIDNCGYITGVDEPPNKRPRHDNHTTTSGGNDQASSSKVWECFTELLEEPGATSDLGGGVKSMVDNCLSELLIDYKQSDPLKWWHDNEIRYPFLGNMAKQFLSAPPISVPSEQLFSGVGNLYNKKRSKLNAEHAEMLLSIKYNKHFNIGVSRRKCLEGQKGAGYY